jgi:hypothetical protein
MSGGGRAPWLASCRCANGPRYALMGGGGGWMDPIAGLMPLPRIYLGIPDPAATIRYGILVKYLTILFRIPDRITRERSRFEAMR